jgi:hypothetical protein
MVEIVVNKDQMDGVVFDTILESTERMMRQKADEIGQTRKAMAPGGLMRFDTARLVNDLLRMADYVQNAAPQGFMQAYPKDADESGGAVIDTTE